MTKQPTLEFERGFAAAAHLLGWISATVVLVLAQKRSAILRFHALQALLADLVLTLFAFVMSMLLGVLVPIVAMALMFLVVAATSASGPDTIGPLVSLVMFVMLAIFMVGSLITMLLPLAIRLVAVIRALQGQVYAYPFFDRWLARPPELEAELQRLESS